MTQQLKLTEIFYSLQGETRTVGLPTIFIRLTGCPLRCQYCDTAYAFTGGQWWLIDDILQHIQQYPTRTVTVTGGEPLAQKNCLLLLEKMCDAGYDVSLETSGAIDIAPVDVRVSRVVDIKTPGSQEVARNRWENMKLLTPHDQVKFVICDREDYEWSKHILQQYHLHTLTEVLFSPSFQQLNPGLLADWIIADRLAVRMQVQLHKILWGDVPGK